MKKFHFKLQKVLEYRKGLEEEAKKDYLQAQSIRIDAEEKLEKMNCLLADILNSSYVSIDEYLTRQNYIEKLEDDIRAQKSVVSLLIDEENGAMNQWNEKRKDATVLDNMYEKHFSEWKKELNRFEQSELDEWANSRSNAA